jgi:hypothetical protein
MVYGSISNGGACRVKPLASLLLIAGISIRHVTALLFLILEGTNPYYAI